MRVIKLGGSLLEMEGLGERFERWHQQQPTMVSLLVAGGGAAAEVVRQMDRANVLNASTAHWLAIRAMQFNARVIEALWPWANRLEALEQLDVIKQEAGLWIVDPWAVLQQANRTASSKLPESWDVTSDSIAAWVALQAKARELVLLKSTLPGAGVTVEQMVDRGYVDRYFAQIAREMPCIRCINLRKRTQPEIVLDGCSNAPTRS